MATGATRSDSTRQPHAVLDLPSRRTKVRDTNLPFADHSFEAVSSSRFIQHASDKSAKREHVAEIQRVLADNGKEYDCRPLQLRQLERLFKDCNIGFQNLCIQVWLAEAKSPGAGRVNG